MQMRNLSPSKDEADNDVSILLAMVTNDSDDEVDSDAFGA